MVVRTEKPPIRIKEQKAALIDTKVEDINEPNPARSSVYIVSSQGPYDTKFQMFIKKQQLEAIRHASRIRNTAEGAASVYRKGSITASPTRNNFAKHITSTPEIRDNK